MKIFLPEIEIGLEEGFNPEKDIFKRSGLGKGLTNLINSADDSIVLAVDGQWGSGKTVFLKMWAGELRKLGFPVIYFDAFAHDYFDDAFLAIAGELIALADEATRIDKGKLTDFKTKAGRAAKIIARASLKMGVRAVTLGAGKAEDLEGLADALASEAESLVDEHIGQLITKQKEQKSTVSAFRDALSNLPALLSIAVQDAQEPPVAKPLIFIIDELDRCRPDFALQILERMKHFFVVPNVHFVLGTNLKQLSNSIAACYGGNIDTNLYLQKFIHLVINLIDKNEYDLPITVPRFINYLVKAHNIADQDRAFVEECAEEIERIALKTNLSLRTIQRAFSIIVIATAFTPSNYFRNSAVVSGLAVMKVVQPSLFEKAKAGILIFSDIKDVLAFVDETEVKNQHLANWSLSLWRFLSDSNLPEEDVQRMQASFQRYSIGKRFTLQSYFANDILDRFESRV